VDRFTFNPFLDGTFTPQVGKSTVSCTRVCTYEMRVSCACTSTSLICTSGKLQWRVKLRVFENVCNTCILYSQASGSCMHACICDRNYSVWRLGITCMRSLPVRYGTRTRSESISCEQDMLAMCTRLEVDPAVASGRSCISQHVRIQIGS